MICPNNQREVVSVLEKHGFEIVVAETYEPKLHFPDFATFMEYGYRGGWLTPFIEEIGVPVAEVPAMATSHPESHCVSCSGSSQHRARACAAATLSLRTGLVISIFAHQIRHSLSVSLLL